MKTIYLSGKINGNKLYKRDFAVVEKLLKDENTIILNPTILPEGMTTEQYMNINFAMLQSADEIVMLPNWVDSEGAKLEHAFAVYIGKKVRYIEENLRRIETELCIEAQAQKCKGALQFAPADGVCHRCFRNIYADAKNLSGDTISQGYSIFQATQYCISTCPHCNASFTE